MKVQLLSTAAATWLLIASPLPLGGSAQSTTTPAAQTSDATTTAASTPLASTTATPAADVLAALTAGIPTAVLVNLLRAQTRTIDFATSNLRGSTVDLYVAGARITENFPIGPRGGSAVNFSVLSYCGVMHVGINSDPAALTDPDSLLECLDESFADLLAIGEAAIS